MAGTWWRVSFINPKGPQGGSESKLLKSEERKPEFKLMIFENLDEGK